MLYTVLAILKSSHMHHYNFNRADVLGMRDWLSSFAWAADFDSTDVFPVCGIALLIGFT